MEIRPLTEAEQKYAYEQSMQLRMQTGSIGVMHGGYKTNEEFYCRFHDLNTQWKSGEFQEELDGIIVRLCSAKNAKKGIRFIDSRYNELFQIADGERIVITDSFGKDERVCRFIDEYHTEIGSHLFHICQFAELMERNGSAYAPAKGREPVKEEAEKIKETDSLIYHSEYGGDSEIQLDVQQYADNGRIAISMITNEEGYPEFFGSLTVNIDAPAPDYCGYLDINNLSNAEKFVSEHGLGEFTGFTGRSGYCEYPLYLFNVDKLRELCPEQMAVYEHSIGADVKKPEKEKSR